MVYRKKTMTRRYPVIATLIIGRFTSSPLSFLNPHTRIDTYNLTVDVSPPPIMKRVIYHQKSWLIKS